MHTAAKSESNTGAVMFKENMRNKNLDGWTAWLAREMYRLE